jgi:Hemerythrin HHE cation binding domain
MANPIDIVASKARGLVKSMEAHHNGLVGVFQTLAKQHGEAASLIERVRDDAGKAESLWPAIEIALVSHEHAELEVVYPVLDVLPSLKPLVERHAHEARELDDMIARLDRTPLASDEWMSLFDALGDAVASHAMEEEHEIFPIALAELGDDRAKQLDDRFKAAQKRIRGSLEKLQH